MRKTWSKWILIGVVLLFISIAITPVNAFLNLTAAGDGSYYIGEDIKFSGTNTVSNFTYLLLTGPGLPAQGARLTTVPKSSPVSEGLNTTFTEINVVDNPPGNFWTFTWGTNEFMNVDFGTYTVYAETQPHDINNISAGPYATFSIVLKKPFIVASVNRATGPKGTVFTFSGVKEGSASPTAYVYLSLTNSTPPTPYGGNLPQSGVNPDDFSVTSSTWNTLTFAQVWVNADRTWSYQWDTGAINAGSVLPGTQYGFVAVMYPLDIDDAIAFGGGNYTKLALGIEGPVTADYIVTTAYGTKPLTVTFTDISSGIPTMSYVNFGDGTEGNISVMDSSVTHTYTSEGTFFPVIHANNSISSDIGTNATISVNVLPFPDTNQAKAYNTMLNDPAILNGDTTGKTVSASPAKLATGAKTATPWGSKPAVNLPGDKAGWFFLIDDNPDANWEHPCRYVFVDDTNTPTATRYDAMSPPINIAISPVAGEIPDPDGTNALGGGSAGGSGGTLMAMGAGVPACSPDCSHYYALLLSGGYDPANNHKRYYSDVKSMYTTLTETYGYPRSHIWVLMSDGTETTFDQHTGDTATNPVTPILVNSATASDFTGSTIGDARKQTVVNTLGSIASTLGPQDNLFIFTTNHGASADTPATQNAILYLWDGQSISDADFVAALDPELNSISITMEQCYSGGFIDNFITNYAGPQKRVIATAANYNEYSWGNAFSYPWIYGVTRNSVSNSVPADSGGDGRAAMDEAYLFAKANDAYATMSPAKENPQFASKNVEGSAQFLTDCTVVPAIRVTSPNIAETWYTGFSRPITWTQTGLDQKQVKIELWKGTPGTMISPAIATVSAGAASQPWTPPSTLVAGSDYWIKIYQSDDTNVWDRSDTNFIIAKGSGTATGSLKVTSVPIGATVTINGNVKANPTDYTFTGITPGTNYVGVHKDGYYDLPVSTVKVAPYQTVTVPFVLDLIQANDCSPFGKLIVTSTPVQDAMVSLNGQYTGLNTNGETELRPGTYTVTIERDGYAIPQAQTVTIPDPQCNNPQDRTTTVNFDLTAKPAWYTFDGFAAPITAGTNNANAGQTVPVKWHLLDRFGTDPVSDPASFAALKSYQVSCTGFTGDRTKAVAESGPGASGLKYAGDGNWQANWKTKKDYANSCRNFFVEFNSGQTSPDVPFKFK